MISISSDTNDESEDFNKINISTDIDEPKSPPVPVLKPLPLTDNVLIKKKQFNYDRRYSNSDSDSDFDHVGRLEVLQSKAATDNVLIRKKSSVVARTYKTPGNFLKTFQLFEINNNYVIGLLFSSCQKSGKGFTAIKTNL